MEKLNNLLNFGLISMGECDIRVYTLATLLLIFVATKVILWTIKKAIYRKYMFKKLILGILMRYSKSLNM